MIQLQRRLLAELRPVRGAMTASVVTRIVYLSLDIALLGFGAWAVAGYATGQGPPWKLLVGVLAVVPAGMAVTSQATVEHAAIAVVIPAAALVLYLLGNRLARHPRERPWDGRLRAGATAMATALPLALLLT